MANEKNQRVISHQKLSNWNKLDLCNYFLLKTLYLEFTFEVMIYRYSHLYFLSTNLNILKYKRFFKWILAVLYITIFSTVINISIKQVLRQYNNQPINWYPSIEVWNTFKSLDNIKKKKNQQKKEDELNTSLKYTFKLKVFKRRKEKVKRDSQKKILKLNA